MFRDETAGECLGDDPAVVSTPFEVGDLFASPREGGSMAWMNLSEYLLIDAAVRDRLGDLRRARPGTKPEKAPTRTLPKILYIASVLRARPRAIDRYIDYFGDRVPQRPGVTRLKVQPGA
jgi:hypothetical protein